jgi:hypothetical protein
MPRIKEMTKCIPRIYKRNAESIGLFFWVNAQKQLVPPISIDQAITNFCRFASVEWDRESAKATYIKIQKEYYEDCKNETT